MFRVTKHVWRTNDNRLVFTGDPDAAFLAYPAGTEVPDTEAQRRGLVDLFAGRKVRVPTEKPPAKGGLTINRISDNKEK